MPIPDYQSIMLPLLKIASDGKDHSVRDAVDTLAGAFKLTVANPVYYGVRIYNRFSSSKLRARLLKRDPKTHSDFPIWRNDEVDWVKTENAHPAIVSEEEWQKVNKGSNNRSNQVRTKSHYQSKYLLVGLVRCSLCGFGFQGWTGRANGKWYPRYIDGGWKNKRQCEYLALDKEALESFAIQAVLDTLSDSDFSRRVGGFLQMLFDAEPGQKKEELNSLEKESKLITGRKENLIAQSSRRMMNNLCIR